MNRLRIVVLVVWTVGLAAVLAAGRYPLFVRAELWPLLLGTLVMFGLFLATTFGLKRGAGRPASAAVWARSLLLLLPLAYMVPLMSTASGSGLNGFALRKRSLGLSTGPDATPGSADAVWPELATGPADGTGKPVALSVVSQRFLQMAGRHVVTEGRVFHDESWPAGTFGLYRFVVVCCAADAMPVQLVVRPQGAGAVENDDWVRVEGTVGSFDADGVTAPAVVGARVTAIEPPTHPYLSPTQR